MNAAGLRRARPNPAAAAYVATCLPDTRITLPRLTAGCSARLLPLPDASAVAFAPCSPYASPKALPGVASRADRACSRAARTRAATSRSTASCFRAAAAARCPRANTGRAWRVAAQRAARARCAHGGDTPRSSERGGRGDSPRRQLLLRPYASMHFATSERTVSAPFSRARAERALLMAIRARCSSAPRWADAAPLSTKPRRDVLSRDGARAQRRGAGPRWRSLSRCRRRLPTRCCAPREAVPLASSLWWLPVALAVGCSASARAWAWVCTSCWCSGSHTAPGVPSGNTFPA